MSVRAQAASAEADDQLVDASGLVGRILAERYRVTGLLGVGGIGRVYLAEHLVLKRKVALKVLLEHYQCVPELQRRFEREAMALAALTHPNIVRIIDFVSGQDLTFLVMELVDGRDLDDIIEEEGALPPELALDVMAQILSSLAYAHERDVIHRDLKPQNVLIRDLAGGRKHAVILDFGLAKFMDGSGPSANLTKTGLIVGTPAYMAPEQASGAHADKRADVYAAGVMLYEMLTGQHPFDGEGQELIRQHLLKPAPTLAAKGNGAVVAPELEALIARALAKDGADRFVDGAAMLEALDALPPDAYVAGESAAGAPVVRTVSRAPTAIAPAPPVPAIEQAPESSPAGRAWAIVLASVLIGGAILGATWMVLRLQGPSDAPLATAVVATDPPTPEPDPEAVAADPEELDEEGADEEGLDEEGLDEEGLDDEGLDDEELDEEGLDEEEDPEATDAEQSEAVGRPAARNPWRRRVPRELARVRRRVVRNHPIRPRHIRAVTSHRRSHPEDARSTLLLAQIYMSRGQAVRALNQYQRAYRRDMTSRGDRRMRRDLIRMAASAPLHERATEALVEIYGEEAVEALTLTIERERDADQHARLEDTLRQLQSAE